MRYIRATAIIVAMFVVLAFGLPTSQAASEKSAPDKIRIGCADALSGWAAADAEISQWRVYDLWAEDVNARGGIYVKVFDKRIPVEMVYYDNRSDPSTAVKMYEKLILGDKVDFVVAPWGTAWHFATAPLANRHGYQMIGVTVSSNALVKKAAAGQLPYYFTHYPPPDRAGPRLVDLLMELGVESVAMVYVSTLYGIEYVASLGPQLAVAGIKVPVMESYPWDIKDFSPLLKKIKAANVDALVAPSYGPDGVLIVEQMMALDYNPKLLWLGSASWSSPLYIQKFGKAAIEGIMSETGWNPEVPYPGARGFYNRYVEKYGMEPDMGCGPLIYATMQVYEQAIEKAGTLDRAKVRDVMAKETFSTISGPLNFVENYNRSYPFIIGQWHNGVYSGVAPKENRAIKVMYPKPAWPK